MKSVSIALLVTSALAAGCSPKDPDRGREKAAEEGDGDCAEGLRSTGLGSGSPVSSASSPSEGAAEVAGHTALVAAGGQVVFLTLFEDGWKVLAAGCSRAVQDEAVPYDCALEGD